jgi:hypothetical protein
MYDRSYAARLVDLAHQAAVAEREEEELSVALAFSALPGQSTQTFVENFYPFALPLPLDQFAPGSDISPSQFQNKLNAYVEYLVAQSRKAIELAVIVRKNTKVHNLTPLLLPLRNFRSGALSQLLGTLFWKLGQTQTPEELIKDEIQKFVSCHPRVYPPGDTKSCYSDGVHFFKSPGRHRHGFYRHTQGNVHEPQCLLNARSRIGGTFDYTFHFDCEPSRGKLAESYPNCHSLPCSPSVQTHVNVAPNDFIR